MYYTRAHQVEDIAIILSATAITAHSIIRNGCFSLSYTFYYYINYVLNRFDRQTGFGMSFQFVRLFLFPSPFPHLLSILCFGFHHSACFAALFTVIYWLLFLTSLQSQLNKYTQSHTPTHTANILIRRKIYSISVFLLLFFGFVPFLHLFFYFFLDFRLPLFSFPFPCENRVLFCSLCF